MKNIIITGSSSGFGLQAVKTFADNNYQVFATMRHPDGKNAKIKQALTEYSNNIMVLEMDVCKEISVKRAVDTILSQVKQIDVLINNAGIMNFGITEAISIDQSRRQMETNYYGAIRTIQAVLPSMRKAGQGLIINTTSLFGRISAPFSGTYAATKHALEGFSQALKYEVSPFGVDVAIVEPGPCGTGLFASSTPPENSDTLASYAEVADLAEKMSENFAAAVGGDFAEKKPSPQWVADAYFKLAETPFGQRPTRTVAGFPWNVDKINELCQPFQDDVLKEMHLDAILGASTLKA